MIPPSSVPLSLFFASTNAFTSKILNTILNQIELGKSNLHMNENEAFSLDYCNKSNENEQHKCMVYNTH
jgi:hypothetical protein